MVSPASVAARCLLQVRPTELPVDPRLMLCFCRGTYVYTYEQALRAKVRPEMLSFLGEKLSAATLNDPCPVDFSRRVVVYLPDADPVRLRFSFAHELGHIALKHRGFEKPGQKTSRREEQEADDFARWLLMPPALVRGIWREQGSLYGEQLTAVFGVSLREALQSESLPPPDPETDKPLCELLLEEALHRIPARVPPGWHAVAVRDPG